MDLSELDCEKRLAVSENQLFFSAAVPCHDLIGLTDCKSMVEIVFNSHILNTLKFCSSVS